MNLEEIATSKFMTLPECGHSVNIDHIVSVVREENEKRIHLTSGASIRVHGEADLYVLDDMLTEFGIVAG
jgi:uncharacterized ubiquitin-like protein YukD